MIGMVTASLAGLALVLGAWAWSEHRRVARLDAALARTTASLEHLERTFGRFAPEAVVERLSAGGSEMASERKVVTVMFADIRGFTALSEQLDPDVMIDVLNGYFHRMSQVIRAHYGHVSRIMGDGLMALFGALQANPWQAADAVKTALSMLEALEAYNAELAQRGLPALRIGVGIHRGEVVAGILGSDHLVEYTVIGDPVNVAARVEALTRTHDADVLITDEVRSELDERFRLSQRPPVPVKGKAEAICTWAVEGFEVPDVGQVDARGTSAVVHRDEEA